MVTIEEQLKNFKENWKMYYSIFPGQYALMMECRSPTPIFCRDVDEIRNVKSAVYDPMRTSYHQVIKIPGRIAGLIRRICDNPKFYS